MEFQLQSSPGCVALCLTLLVVEHTSASDPTSGSSSLSFWKRQTAVEEEEEERRLVSPSSSLIYLIPPPSQKQTNKHNRCFTLFHETFTVVKVAASNKNTFFLVFLSQILIFVSLTSFIVFLWTHGDMAGGHGELPGSSRRLRQLQQLQQLLQLLTSLKPSASTLWISPCYFPLLVSLFHFLSHTERHTQ